MRRSIVCCTALLPPCWKSRLQSIRCVGLCNEKGRHFSSRQKGSNFKLDGLAFSIAPEKALSKFEKWARDEQGLSYILSWSSVRITAAYAPVWSFDVNLRFKVDGSIMWSPSMFAQAYPNQTTIYISGLSVYSGHSYRRTLMNPLHNTTLVFLGDQVQPFGHWMLRDMKLSNNTVLQVFPDPWNATKGHAQEVLREDLTKIARSEQPGAEVHMQFASAKRVYMPVYVVEYSIVGMEYQAFLSGCDDGAAVSGVNHQLWANATSASMPSSQSIFQGATSAAQLGTRLFGPRGIATVLAIALQFVGSVAARLLMRLPAVAFLGSIVIAFRKILFPWLDHRYASAEWERQREQEAAVGDRMFRSDDFDDVLGSAQQYFEQNKSQILRTLGGDTSHHRGDFDWYKEWEEWARRQYNQQAQQQGGYQYGQQEQYQQQQQQRRTQRPSPKSDYKWDFDPNDPYSVLGIRRGASKAEVSAAFRREMLKHHPDTQVNATEAVKARAQERSKYITEAYRKIKTEMR